MFFRALLVLLLVTVLACTSEPENEGAGQSRPSDTLTKRQYHFTPEPATDFIFYSYTAYVCRSNTPIFSDSLFTRRIGSLSLGDSVEIIGGNKLANSFFGTLNPKAVYKIKLGLHDSAYIHGAAIGMGWHADVDGEPGQELITARYTSLLSKFEDDVADNPIELQIIKHGKIKATLPLKGYSEMMFTYLGDKGFSRPVKFFEFSSGYPACGYPAKVHTIVYDGTDYRILTSREHVGDADVYASWSDYVFPADSGGAPNQLIIYDRLFSVPDEGADTVRLTTRKEVYTYAGQVFNLTEVDTTQRPYPETLLKKTNKEALR
jgi:hypothetical protein